MMYDTVEILKSDTLPVVTETSTVTLIYLNATFEGKTPGFYAFVSGTWEPFGAGGNAGQAVKTATITTTDLQIINLNDHDPEGLLLSVMVTKAVSGTRSVSLMDTETQAVLETVILNNTYTTISIPQPHRLYSLKVEANLTVTIKTI